ncbi:hypothetical protein TDB9533_03479 [Thalassocella blandensis]|nr:hypothetical protein TDB9533_03479 [Thalassocella blandensis]
MDTSVSSITDNTSNLHEAVNKNLYVRPKRTVEERKHLKQRIPELLWTERLIRGFPKFVDARTEHVFSWHGHELPIYSLTLGNRDPATPTVLFTGGVHGLERIGTQVILAWLQSFLERASWDKNTAALLQQIQIVVVPIVNPVGIYRNTRSNGNDVDLNRNAPIEAEARVPFIGGGHRISPRIPCYRGKPNNEMEKENQILESIIKRQILNHPISLVLDLHSGLGMRDHIWFPYAYRKRPIGNIAKFLALKFLWERTYPRQPYIYEPQSVHYLAHGDIWDYFYKLAKTSSQCTFMPLTLEMGSWNWVRKNPLQLKTLSGIFNPQIAHRHSRVLRRHLVFLDFILSAAINSSSWLPDKAHSEVLKQAAKNIWYSE